MPLESKHRNHRRPMVAYSHAAFEVAAVVFIEENGGAPGVRLREPGGAIE